MPFVITLPDASTRIYEKPMSLEQIAADIGSGLAKATLAGKIDNERVDASEVVDSDCTIEILTAKNPDGLEVLRHSCAHLLGHALKQLIPEAKMAIGPTIEHGFYYDVETPEPLTDEFLPELEARMIELAKKNYLVEREVVSRERAREVFAERDEPYKLEVIDGIPDGETMALYHHEEYTDMCRGPHVTNTRHLRHLHLTRLAGAYWRGDSKNQMLTRIYGVAFPSSEALQEHLHWLEEAAKRDHRKIGKNMDLFHIQDEAPGMVFWHPNGWLLYRFCEDYIRTLILQSGFQEVHTPQLIDYSLWERSGHADKFGDAMFRSESEHRDYAVKPMNCPAHVQIYNQSLRSYRDLPLRLSEFGILHRNEPSGTLHGLLRVRKFTQDDGHIFCTEDQLESEIIVALNLNIQAYNHFGFSDIQFKLSTRPEQRVGEDALWDRSEAALESALNACDLEWELQPGEGAFYGPKIELSLCDSLGRVWQCGTVQVDFSMPLRLGAKYVDSDGERREPVMIHRAILGSLERFVGILLEHYHAGLPLWLAPVQAVVMNITDAHSEYAEQVRAQLAEAGFRVEADLRNEKVGYKIREHTQKRVPYQLIVGDREQADGTVAVRLPTGEDHGSLTVEQLVGLWRSVLSERRLMPSDMSEKA